MLTKVMIFLFIAGSNVHAKYFTIIGPKSGHVGSKYRAVLASTSEDKSKVIEVSLFSKDREIQSKFYYLNPNVLQEILFDIPKEESSPSYALKTKLFSLESSFEEEIKIIADKPKVYVKTDKSIYKSGDNVKLSVFVLDAELKPYQYENITVTFADEAEKTLSSIHIPRSQTGFYEEYFELVEKLNEARMVFVTVNDELSPTKLLFDVADSRKPQFQVHINPFANDLSLDDEKVTIIIYAKYLAGRIGTFVKGKATVKATVFNANDIKRKLQETSKIIDNVIDSSTVSFNFSDDLKLDENINSIVKLHVTFQDKSGRREESFEVLINVHKDVKYKFEIVEEAEFFVPGQPYKLRALIKNFDSSIVKEMETATLNVRKQFFKKCAFSKTETPSEIGTMLMPALTQTVKLINGIAEFTINAPIDAENLIFTIVYKNSFKDFKLHREPVKHGKNLELTVDNGSLKVEQTINVSVKSASKMNELFSVIIGQTGLIHEQKHSFVNSNTFALKVNANQSMLPVSELTVYFIENSGEIVFAQIQLRSSQDVIQLSGNHLEIGTRSDKMEQGTTTTVSVNTAKNSMVGLIAVEHPTVTSTSTIQARSNTFLVSNALKETLTCASVRETSPGDADASLRSDEAFSRSNIWIKSSTKVWIFKRFRVDDTGTHSFEEVIPRSIIPSSYVISGFSENEEHELGVAEPRRIEIVKEFFIEIHATDKVTIDEVMKVEIFVFNFVRNSKSPEVSVALNNDDEAFEIVQPMTSQGKCSFATSVMSVLTSATGTETVNFYVRPIKTGFFKLKVKASANENLNDSAEKNFNVEKNHLKTRLEKTKHIDLRKKKFDGHYFIMDSPSSFVEGSVQNEFLIVSHPERCRSNSFNLILDFIDGDSKSIRKFFIENANASFSHKTEIMRPGGVSLQAEGHDAVADISFVQKYLEKPMSIEDRFSVELYTDGQLEIYRRNKAKLYQGRKDNTLVAVCISLKIGSSQNLVVAEISLPSGYDFDESSRQSVLENGVKAVKFHREKSLLTLVFDSLSTTQACVDIQAKRKFFVWTKTPNSVRVYEEGKEDHFTIKYYNILSSLTC